MTQSLLRIDVKAEIRKLCGQRFKSPGEYTVELVRLATGANPTKVAVAVSRRALVLSHDGTCPGDETLGDLMTLFDPRRPDPERHNALVAIEARDGLAILAAFAVPGSTVILETTFAGKAHRLEFSPRGARRLDPSNVAGFCLWVKGRNRQPRSEMRMLKEACRFSPTPIFLNRKKISAGLRVADCLQEARVTNHRVTASVGIPTTGDLTRIVRLKNGILLRDTLRPSSGELVFHAIVEESDNDLDATWATLRQAARVLYARLRDRYEDLAPSGRERASRLLFARSRVVPGDNLLEGVRTFVLTGVGRVALDRVADLAARGPLYAVGIDHALRRYETEGRHVFRLDPDQRSFLVDQMGLSLRTPPQRRPFFGRIPSLRRVLRRLPHYLGKLLGGTAGTPVEARQLTGAEQQFLGAATAALRSRRIHLSAVDETDDIRIFLTDGQRRAWIQHRRDAQTVVCYLSRTNDSVRAVIEKFCDQERMLSPGLAFLCDGAAGTYPPP